MDNLCSKILLRVTIKSGTKQQMDFSGTLDAHCKMRKVHMQAHGVVGNGLNLLQGLLGDIDSLTGIPKGLGCHCHSQGKVTMNKVFHRLIAAEYSLYISSNQV